MWNSRSLMTFPRAFLVGCNRMGRTASTTSRNLHLSKSRRFRPLECRLSPAFQFQQQRLKVSLSRWHSLSDAFLGGVSKRVRKTLCLCRGLFPSLTRLFLAGELPCQGEQFGGTYGQTICRLLGNQNSYLAIASAISLTIAVSNRRAGYYIRTFGLCQRLSRTLF